MAEYSIGIDLGGTNLRAAAIDRSGKMLDKIAAPTDFVNGREAVLHDIVSNIEKLRDKQGADGLKGIGVGVPGFIRIKEGFITNSPNLPYFENFPVRDELSKRLNTPVILENDANAAAQGETWIGAGKDYDDLVLLTLGHRASAAASFPAAISCAARSVWRASWDTSLWYRTAILAPAAIRDVWKSTLPRQRSWRWRTCCISART